MTTADAAAPPGPELLLTRVFEAPRALVFKVWTEPAHLVRWWGPAGFTTPSCQMDVRPGGPFRICMRSPDGRDHWLRGVYREITPPERLVCTWAWEDEEGAAGHETVVTITLDEHGAGTRLTLHQAVFEAVSARDAHDEGWSECLDRLADYLMEV